MILMESIQELREQLQKEKIEGRERPWAYRLLQRGPSIYITRILLTTPITPNQLTVISILLSLGGCALLLHPLWHYKLIGLFLFYLNLIFDRVDGEVARYKKIYSLKGIYLDEINHLIIPPLFFVALGWGISSSSILPRNTLLLTSVAAALASVFLRATLNLPYHIFMKKYIKYKSILPISETKETVASIRSAYAALYPAVRTMHQLQDLLHIIILFAIAFTGEYFLLPDYFLFPVSSYLLVGFGIFLTFFTIENILKGTRTIEARMSELESALNAYQREGEHERSNFVP